MPIFDERIDEYISGTKDFARPILRHLRQLVHAACPEVVETIKWSYPHFDYKGMFVSMAGFSQHCAFGFWKGSLLHDPNHYLNRVGESGMSNLGRIRSLADLPPEDALIGFLLEAMELNDKGLSLPKPVKPKQTSTLPLPEELSQALAANPEAEATFHSLSHAGRNDYIRWIQHAKTQTTRERRTLTSLDWLEEGKAWNWKYKNPK
jgi:uncharacterized protein YdeI (YjbR/CyaY-like superfamily)